MTDRQHKVALWGKRLAKALLLALLLLTLLLGIAWSILRSDNSYVIQRLQKIANEKWNTDVDLAGYTLRFIKPFPTIEAELNDLSLATKGVTQYPVLKINQATSNINLWELWDHPFTIENVQLDSIWIHLHKDSLNNSNLSFDQNSERESNRDTKSHLTDLPSMSINYLDFHIQNDFKKKWQWIKLSDAQVTPTINQAHEWLLKLKSDCHFEGLVFNKNGDGFLMDKKGEIDLNIALRDQGKTMYLDRSILRINQSKFDLEGRFYRRDTNRLQLQISNETTILSEVRPLLSRKVNQTLRDIKIDDPINAKFTLDELLLPGRKGAMQVDFEIDDSKVEFKEITMTDATIKGYYSNDCDRDGFGSETNSCIAFTQMDGSFYDVLPAKLTGVIDDLKNPKVDAAGTITINLPQLNPLLVSSGKVTFTDGKAALDFEYQGNLTNVLSAPFDEQNIKMKGQAMFKNVGLDLPNLSEPIPLLSGQLSFDNQKTFLDKLSLDWMESVIELSGQLNNLPEFLFFKDQALNGQLRLHFDQLDLNKFTKGSSTEKQASKPLNYQEIEKVARKITSNINGSIKVEIDRLLYDTLYLTNLKTEVQLSTPFHSTSSDSSLITIDQLSAKFMGTDSVLIDLGLSKDSISKVNFNIGLPSAGSIANMFLPKGTSLSAGNASLDLKTKIPLASLLKRTSILADLEYDGSVVFKQAEVNLNSFSWPVKKMMGKLKFTNDQMVFEDLKFRYEHSPFILNGKIDNYAFFKTDTEKAIVDIQLRGSHLDLRNNERKLNRTPQINVEKSVVSPAQLFRDLDTIFHYAEGEIDLQLDSVLTIDHTITPFIVQANLLPDDTNPNHHQIMIDSFNVGFGAENNIRGHAHLSNPEDPKIDAKVQVRMKFEQLEEFLPSEYLEMKEGSFTMDLNYQSLLFDTINAENYLLNAEVKGQARITNGKLFYNYRGFTFDDIYGHVTFDNRSLFIRDLDLKINDNRLFADGRSIDFFPFFILPNRKAKFDLNVATPRFDFGGFTAPHGLGKDTLLLMEESLPFSDSTINVLSKTGSFIDQLLAKGSVNINADFKELVYRDFVAGNVSGNISLQPDIVQLSNVSMDVAEGVFKIDGAISDVVRHQPKMEVAVQMEQNDMSEIFRQFENFGQEELGYKNMEGIASADIQFKASINSNYSILPETMHGDMRIKLSGGQLKDVGALKKVTGFLSRKRQMDNILIDTLETFTHIRGNTLFIDQFYLHSSSFDFGVEGIYSLGKDNKTRILFAVPISNLFQRHLSQKELQSGTSKRKGMRLFIEAREKKGKMRFFLKVPLSRKKYRLQEEIKTKKD